MKYTVFKAEILTQNYTLFGIHIRAPIAKIKKIPINAPYYNIKFNLYFDIVSFLVFFF